MGLAIARRLQQRDGVSTVLIEKHSAVGTETSSRNSEVGKRHDLQLYPFLSIHLQHSRVLSVADVYTRSSMRASTTARTR